MPTIVQLPAEANCFCSSLWPRWPPGWHAEHCQPGGGDRAGPDPLAIFGLGTLYWSLASPNPDVLAETYIPRRSDDRGYVSSQTCRSCHPGTYASWHKTYHRTMTQVATPATIVAGARNDFEQRRRFDSHGQSARISRRENRVLDRHGLSRMGQGTSRGHRRGNRGHRSETGRQAGDPDHRFTPFPGLLVHQRADRGTLAIPLEIPHRRKPLGPSQRRVSATARQERVVSLPHMESPVHSLSQRRR